MRKFTTTSAAIVAVLFCGVANATTIETTTLIDPAGVGGFDLPAGGNGVSTADWTFASGTNQFGRSINNINFIALGRADGGGPIAGTASGTINQGGLGAFDSDPIAGPFTDGDIFDFSGVFAQTTGFGGPAAAAADYSLELLFDDGLGNITPFLLSTSSTLTGTNTGRVAIGTELDPISPVAGPVTPTSGHLVVNESAVYSGPDQASVQLRVTITAGVGQVVFDSFELTRTVIPEPTSVALGLFGLAGALVTRRRS